MLHNLMLASNSQSSNYDKNTNNENVSYVEF